MKTQKNNLAFNKCSVTELNDSQMLSVDGGTTPLCVIISMNVIAWTVVIYTETRKP